MKDEKPLPESTGEHEIRIMRVMITPTGQPSYGEHATFVEIEDDACGEFVKVWQNDAHLSLAKAIAIDPEEWPILRETIDAMMSRCRAESDD